MYFRCQTCEHRTGPGKLKSGFLVFFSRQLDLSFNRIKKIEGLETLTQVKKLFLVQNKISKIENLEPLVNVTMLELGSNRIRVSNSHYMVI